MTIDTHTGYKKLVEAGVPERQAEVTVHLFSEWVERELVTRDYLDLRLADVDKRFTEIDKRFIELEKQIVELEMRMEIRMVELEKRLTNRMYAVAVSMVAVLGTLMTILNLTT